MDELLAKLGLIKTSLVREKEMSRQELEERTKTLKAYASSLDEVAKLVNGLEHKLKTELSVLQSEVSKTQNNLNQLTLEMSKRTAAHDSEIKGKKETIEGLDKQHRDLESRHDHMSKVNDGLTQEGRMLEEQNLALRGQNAALERRKAHMEGDAIVLQGKIDALLKQEADLVSSIEEKQKYFAKVSSDAAIIEKRAK